MSNIDIIRAWKDEDYRNSLSEEQRSQLPDNPAGAIELSDKDMESIAGGKAGNDIVINSTSCTIIVKKLANGKPGGGQGKGTGPGTGKGTGGGKCPKG